MKSKRQKTKSRFSLAYKDPRLLALLEETDQKTLALWAIACVERVLPYFEDQYPQDLRPRNAIEVLRAWIDTGVFRMAEIRKASLGSHAAAREVGQDNPARSAARAAGQAVATAHVPAHAIGAANYAVQAIYRATDSAKSEAMVAQERDWQYERLCWLRGTQHHIFNRDIMPSYDEKSCGAVIFKRAQGQIQYLTVEYKKEPGYWGLNKGHVEPGESELETARREIYEEVGLSDLTFLDGFRAEISYQPKPGVTKLVVFFLAEAHDDQIAYHFAEHIDHRWLPYQDVIAQLTYPDDQSVVTQAAQFLKDPNHK